MLRKIIPVLIIIAVICTAALAEETFGDIIEETAEEETAGNVENTAEAEIDENVGETTAVDTNWTDISDAEGLLAIASNPVGHYRLVNDIDMADVEWMPFSFNGELDGGGYAILNLTITQPGAERFTSIDANKKKYDTVGAAMFSTSTGANIHDLSLLGLGINVTTDENCFCAGFIAGGSAVTITNCDVEGRIWLHQTGANTGVGGLLGYAQANVGNCTCNVELVLVDNNTEAPCEEFAGGVLACGVVNIIDCNVKTRLYASVHGYCHNGGLIGLYWRGSLGQQKCKISGCSVDFHSTFFEDIESRRAYNEPYIGEEFSYGMTLSNNQTVNFEVTESKDFSVNLYPCTCGSKYDSEVVEPTETECGYTIYTCTNCGYSLRGKYTPRLKAE